MMEDNLVPQNIDCSFTGKVFGRLVVHLEDLITREKFTVSRAACWREKKIAGAHARRAQTQRVTVTQLDGSLIRSRGTGSPPPLARLGLTWISVSPFTNLG